ncbi:MAG: DUF296 domain-containing protein [Myxococcales bacterium]|nr:DNA-binding protein [Myxococcota bacterium]MDW8284213.1 DUF296 domain-containing protein [Myxococcales bacterium]
MITAVSQHSRRLLLRLDRGSDLLRGIADACRAAGVRSGQVHAGGWLEEVELVDYDPAARCLRPPRRLAGPLQLVSLQGTVAEQEGTPHVAARAVLSRESDNGVQVFAGLVHAGSVLLAEVVVVAFADLIVCRGTDRATGLETWTELRPAPPPTVEASSSQASSSVQAQRPEGTRSAVEPVPSGEPLPTAVAAPLAATPRPPASPASPSLDWAAVQRASRSQEGPEAPSPRRGDWLEHPTFGRCSIERFEENLERLWVRVRGRLVELSLEHLSVEPVGQEGQSWLFRATKRRDDRR